MSTKISAGGVKKGKNDGEKVVTANALTHGGVIYLMEDGTWSGSLQRAVVVEGDEALRILTQAANDESVAVGPYLMDVDRQSGRITPAGRGQLRERIRDRGPTIHPQFGRQAVRQPAPLAPEPTHVSL